VAGIPFPQYQSEDSGEAAAERAARSLLACSARRLLSTNLPMRPPSALSLSDRRSSGARIARLPKRKHDRLFPGPPRSGTEQRRRQTHLLE